MERLYYLWSKNKGATAKLICVFTFAYAKSRFSHGAAHLSNISYINFPTQTGGTKTSMDCVITLAKYTV